MENLKFIIASYTHVIHGKHTKIGGPALALRDFLKIKCKKLLCIWQPVSISDDWRVFTETYQDKKEISRHVARFPKRRAKDQGEINIYYFLLKLRDLLYTIYFVLTSRDHFDVYVGVEAHNALLGVAFRRFRRVKKVIYYNLEYGEVRFQNRLLNSIFHKLDRFCAHRVDCIWNLSAAMTGTRQRLDRRPDRIAPQIVVPIGAEFKRVNRPRIDEIVRTHIVYLGLLSEIQGVRLIMDALPKIIERIPDLKLTVIGTGPLEDELINAAKQAKWGKHVEFLGFVEDDLEVERILTRHAIGLAPYVADKVIHKQFTDVTKPRVYMQCGLPVIITRVPTTAREIEARRAGLVIGDNSDELAGAVLRLVTDENLYKEYRDNAIRLAAEYDWDRVFEQALSKTMPTIGLG